MLQKTGLDAVVLGAMMCSKGWGCRRTWLGAKSPLWDGEWWQDHKEAAEVCCK